MVKLPKVKTAEFENNLDPDIVAHNEQPHLDLPYLPSSLFSLTPTWTGHFIFANFVIYFNGTLRLNIN